MPKKPPLISKDHERAYFDSADWALGKQGVQKPKGPLEALRPNSQHSSRHVTGNLLMLLRTKKGEVFMLRMHLPMSNQHSIFSSCAAIVLPFNPKK
ncbi:PREDICTED: uncharacterized protein LOC109351976 isoform X3 [Lupinus angustifolius]|uniref:uncharacterized protein LOC109351976 isoform X3 n=1 Tax=Lupinus angustifolius TaxID=3871 RepID=UPI00092FAAEB|nr:PREDICTED: uncharacterized protein LOC109351976 isoform X3 [Lupinus angustifolius]